jgi:hypothetical protein
MPTVKANARVYEDVWSCPGFVEPPDKMDLRHLEKFDEISKFW